MRRRCGASPRLGTADDSGPPRSCRHPARTVLPCSRGRSGFPRTSRASCRRPACVRPSSVSCPVHARCRRAHGTAGSVPGAAACPPGAMSARTAAGAWPVTSAAAPGWPRGFAARSARRGIPATWCAWWPRAPRRAISWRRAGAAAAISRAWTAGSAGMRERPSSRTGPRRISTSTPRGRGTGGPRPRSCTCCRPKAIPRHERGRLRRGPDRVYPGGRRGAFRAYLAPGRSRSGGARADAGGLGLPYRGRGAPGRRAGAPARLDSRRGRLRGDLGRRPPRSCGRAALWHHGLRRLRAPRGPRPRPGSAHRIERPGSRAAGLERMDPRPRRPRARGIGGARPQLRQRAHVRAPGAPAQRQAARRLLLSNALPAGPGPPDPRDPDRGFSLPDRGPEPGRHQGGARRGSGPRARSSLALLHRDVARLRGDAIRTYRRPLGWAAGCLLRHRGLLRASGHPGGGRALPGTARLVMERLFVAGLSHHTAPIAVREQLALEDDNLREILSDLAARGTCAEIMILSTCNRVEVYGVADVPGEARSVAFRQMGAQRGIGLPSLEPLLYTRSGAEAVQHAFRVASSLDSMVLGEPQILGQVKDAFALAQACRTVGPVLHSLMSQAFAVAKRVRSDTEVGRHAVSVSFAAVELARRIFDGLDGRSVLLVGAGEMGELAARHFQDHGTLPVYVANRTAGRAQALARELAGTAVPFEDLFSVMAQVDIVITSTAAPEPIITSSDVAGALHGRRGRPLFFIDIAVPRNVEPAVNDISNVFVYDVDALRSVVDANLRERKREAQRAESLVEREVAKFS